MNNFCTLFLLLFSVQIYAFNNVDALEYIDKYKEIAVTEMHANGVPASIKMAQAILESNCGKSDLAISANNHFGIKCGSTWTGETFYKKDDDRDRQGRLRPSCFRVFSSAEESFRAHSQFLRDPKKEYRYGHLFTIEKTDYKSWAWGLKKSGYATNPAYANLLIRIIEQYALYAFDYYEENNIKYVDAKDVVVQAKPVKTHEKLTTPSKTTTVNNTKSTNPSDKVAIKSDQIYVNDRKAVLLQAHESLADIADKYDVSIEKLEGYNEFFLDEKQYQSEGSFVYLEKKSRKYRGSSEYHIVKEGEDLLSIAQKYGLRLSTIERKNKLSYSMIPLPGQRIKLKGKSVPASEIPLTYDDVEILESPMVSEPTLVENKKELPTKIEASTTPEVPTFDLNKADLVTQNDLSEEKISIQNYTVVPGDTLYKISKMYNISVEDLMEYNQLQSTALKVGQTLKILP